MAFAFLAPLFLSWAVASPELERCQRFLTLTKALPSQMPVTAPGDPSPLNDEVHAVNLVTDEVYGASPEIETLLASLNPETIWKLKAFFTDLVNLVDEGYLTQLLEADKALPPEGTVIDLGCGSGLVCAYLAHERPQRKVLGLDRQRWALEVSHQRTGLLGTAPVNFIHADLTRLPFASDSLAGATLHNSLFHLAPAQKRQTLARLRQILKPGGILVVQEGLPPGYGNGSWDQFLFDTAWGVQNQHPELSEGHYRLLGAYIGGTFARHFPTPGDAHFLTGPEQAELLKSNGFEVLDMVPYNKGCYSRVIARKPD